MPARTLKKYAKSKDWIIRRAVVNNPSTPRDILEALAKDSDSDVKELAIIRLSEMQKP